MGCDDLVVGGRGKGERAAALEIDAVHVPEHGLTGRLVLEQNVRAPIRIEVRNTLHLPRRPRRSCDPHATYERRAVEEPGRQGSARLVLKQKVQLTVRVEVPVTVVPLRNQKTI